MVKLEQQILLSGPSRSTYPRTEKPESKRPSTTKRQLASLLLLPLIVSSFPSLSVAESNDSVTTHIEASDAIAGESFKSDNNISEAIPTDVMGSTSSVEVQSDSHSNHGSESAHHGPSLVLLGVNFALYVGIMFLLLRKKVSAAWKLRRQRISNAVIRGETLLSEAREAHVAAVGAESQIDEKLEKLKKGIISLANQEAHDLLEAAQDRAKRLGDQSIQLADAERNRRVDSIKREFARKVSQRAEEMIRERLTKEGDRNLRMSAITSINGLQRLFR